MREVDYEIDDARRSTLVKVAGEDPHVSHRILAAAEYLDENGEALPRSVLERLVRRGLGAHYAEARQAFYRAGRRHVGPDVRKWAPEDVIRRARRGESGGRRNDPDQTSLF